MTKGQWFVVGVIGVVAFVALQRINRLAASLVSIGLPVQQSGTISI